MPKKVSKTKVSTRASKPAFAKKESILSQIKWGESYTSLFLGAVVVVVALILIFSFIKSQHLFTKEETGSTSTISEETNKQLPATYTVKDGEYLWSIAEKIYGSGYNWVDLAEANKISNPDVVNTGTKLVVPNVEIKTVTVEPKTANVGNPILGNTYTVVKGDSLWDISVRAYGDGYKWPEIARINNLANPDLIFSGNILKLPR